jgi:hypothetical protein
MDTLLSFVSKFQEINILQCFFSTAFLGIFGFELPAAAPLVTLVAHDVRSNA